MDWFAQNNNLRTAVSLDPGFDQEDADYSAIPYVSYDDAEKSEMPPEILPSMHDYETEPPTDTFGITETQLN